MTFWIFVGLLGLLCIWEAASRIRQRLLLLGKPLPSADEPLGHYNPELERRRRLDAAARRQPGPARWG